MTSERFQAMTSRYADLRVGVVGDFCLDRYLEIDPARAEISIETGLEVRVSLFIKEGEIVRVNTQTGEVAGRA